MILAVEDRGRGMLRRLERASWITRPTPPLSTSLLVVRESDSGVGADLAFKDGDLVTQDESLHVLVPIVHGQQPQRGASVSRVTELAYGHLLCEPDRLAEIR